jgi:hypothetical protein
VAEVAFGAEISEDRSRCSVAKAWRESDGRVAVKVVWSGAPVVAPEVIDALYMSEEPVAVALDPRSQSATLCAVLAEHGIVARRLGAEEVAVAHGEFMDLLSSKPAGLRHFGQPGLTAAVRGAQDRPLAGAKALERRVGTDQSPLTAAEFAVFGLLRWEEVSRPGAWVI